MSKPQLPDEILPAGTRLESYEIRRVLGQGGFGVTYLAEDLNLAAPVAIKEYLPFQFARRGEGLSVVGRSGADGASYRWGLERFIEEARTLARFNHPAIVRVLRLFEANGTAYMVMSFEAGQTLKDYCKRLGRGLDEAELLRIFLPLMEGLEDVHAAGFLHRDIKPANIIIRADGNPVLIDFGAARQAAGEQTQALTAVLSPGYAPLEQYGGAGRQGPWTDIYALGACMLWAVTGRAPQAASERNLAQMGGEADQALETLSRRGARVGPAVMSAIGRALALAPAQRPQSLGAFRALLTGDPEGEAPTEALTRTTDRPGRADGVTRARPPATRRLPPPPGKATPRLGARGWAVAAGAVLLLAVMVAAAPRLRQWAQTRQNPPAATATLAPAEPSPAAATTRPAAAATPSGPAEPPASEAMAAPETPGARPPPPAAPPPPPAAPRAADTVPPATVRARASERAADSGEAPSAEAPSLQSQAPAPAAHTAQPSAPADQPPTLPPSPLLAPTVQPTLPVPAQPQAARPEVGPPLQRLMGSLSERCREAIFQGRRGGGQVQSACSPAELARVDAAKREAAERFRQRRAERR